MMSSSPTVVDPPAAALLMRIQSPAFTTAPPGIIHPERIPPSIVAASAAQQQRVFTTRCVSVWLLRDVLVAYEGLVFDRAGALYRPSITQHGPGEIAWAASQVQLAVKSAGLPEYDMPLVLGKKRGAENYGHWLMEMLPMLHLVLDRLRDRHVGALLHDVSDPQLGEVMQTSLRRVGIGDVRVRVSGQFPVRVRRLILVDGLTDHGVYMSPLLRDCHDRLAAGVVGNRHEKVFVARAPGMRRNFANVAAVEAVARAQGYYVLRPDGLSLLQQIAALRDARVVAGAMGAAMTSLCFAARPAQALLFAGAGMPDTFFWFVANLFGHRYREIRCLQAEAVSGHEAGYDGDLLIDDDEVAEHLAAA